jgi:hypothetical protein
MDVGKNLIVKVIILILRWLDSVKSKTIYKILKQIDSSYDL